MKIHSTHLRTSGSLGRARRSGGLLLSAGALMTAAAAATLALGGLQTRYDEARVFEVSYSSESVTETTKMDMMRDGERMDRGGPGGGRSQTFELAYIDTVLGATDGAPTKIQRAFESVGGEMVMEGREEAIERSLESEFEGITLVLSEGDDGVEVEVTDGEAPDGDRLEGHALRLPLDGLMPTEAVEAGGEWEIDGAAFLAAMGVQVQGKLIDRPERGGEGGGEGGGRGGRGRGGWQRMGGGGGENMLASGDWTITGTLTDETRDVDGTACAVILIEAEVEGEPEGGPPREGMQMERSYSGKFEAELLFCVEEARPVSFEAAGSYELSTEMSSESERGSMEMSRVEETKWTVNVTIGASTASDDK